MSAYFHSCYFFTFLYMFSQLLHFSSSKLFQLPLTLFMNQKCELLNFSRYHLFLRILLLLVLAWITLLLSNLVLIVVPISLGRALFNAIPLLPLTRGIKFPLFSVTLDIKFNGKIIVCTIFLEHTLSYLWNGNFDFSLTSFNRYICIHSWKLHYTDCRNWIQVCCTTCPNRKSWGSFKTNLEVVWHCPQKFCTFVNMGRPLIFFGLLLIF